MVFSVISGFANILQWERMELHGVQQGSKAVCQVIGINQWSTLAQDFLFLFLQASHNKMKWCLLTGFWNILSDSCRLSPIFVWLPLSGPHCGPDHREGFLLRSWPELRQGLLLHLQRWNHQTVDVPLLHGSERLGEAAQRQKPAIFQPALLRFFFKKTDFRLLLQSTSYL